jgi:hypothetical protein
MKLEGDPLIRKKTSCVHHCCQCQDLLDSRDQRATAAKTKTSSGNRKHTLNFVCKSQGCFFKVGFQIVKHTNRSLNNTKILMIGESFLHTVDEMSSSWEYL